MTEVPFYKRLDLRLKRWEVGREGRVEERLEQTKRDPFCREHTDWKLQEFLEYQT